MFTDVKGMLPVSGDGYDGEIVTRGPLKLLKDGSIGGHSALMREPYLDVPTTKGVEVVGEIQLVRSNEVKEDDKEGK